jgi:hypothetical protein
MHALGEFIDTFVGYGNLRAPLWFFGMEEGGGRDVAELLLRVNSWDVRGRQACEDLAGYHRAIGVTKFFGENRPRLQPTWTALMKALQARREGPTDPASLRMIQATEFGAHDGPVALLEMLPLPSPSLGSWPYSELANLVPYLRDRASYVANVLPARVQRLGRLVQQHEPAAVVCYGLSYTEYWSSVFAVPLEAVTLAERRCLSGRVGRTQVLVAPHPARANATKLWEAIGLQLRESAL